MKSVYLNILFAVILPSLLLNCNQSAQDTEFLYKRAHAYYISKNLDDALRVAGDVLKQAPENQDALILTGKILFDEKKYKQAANYFRRVQAPKPHVLLFMARALGRTSDGHAEALQILDELIKNQGGSTAVHYERGRLLENTGKIALATESYYRAIASSRELPLAHLRLGKLLWSQGLKKEANANFGQALYRTGNDERMNSLINKIRLSGENTQNAR